MATVLDNLQVNGTIVRRGEENGQKRRDQNGQNDNGQNDNGKHH